MDLIGNTRALADLAGKQLFFVGGAPRSGTTWLQQLLNAHPDCSCRGEGLFWAQLATPLDALMTARGVVVSVNSDSDERIRRLYQEAGVGVRYGNMPVNEALKMVTLNPAKQLGVDKMVGTLETGKDGDIAVFSAHPFAPEAMVEYTIVDGKVLFDRSEANTLRKVAAQEKGPGGQR